MSVQLSSVLLQYPVHLLLLIHINIGLAHTPTCTYCSRSQSRADSRLTGPRGLDTGVKASSKVIITHNLTASVQAKDKF